MGLRSVVAAAVHDVRTVQQRDPAARGHLDVVLWYPGLHALWAHRVANLLWHHRAQPLARGIAHLSRAVTAIEIHPGAQVGPGLFIDHGAGVVIGETAVIGRDCTIYHGVTLGGTSFDKVKRHPTLGDRVIVGAGAKILGAIEVGDDSRIGANAVLVRSVAGRSVVVGVPGQVVVKHNEPREDPDRRDQPDLVGLALAELLDRMDRVEQAVTGAVATRIWRQNIDGVWIEEPDYSI